jgi:hypothetical protein
MAIHCEKVKTDTKNENSNYDRYNNIDNVDHKVIAVIIKN